MSKKLSRRLPWFRRIPLWLTILLSLFVLGSGFIGLLVSNQGLEASFADNVLRPLLGSERTIALENVVFGLQDKLNQIRHKQLSPEDYVARQPAASPTPTNRLLTHPTLPEPTPPPNIQPIISGVAPLAGEGQWSALSGNGLYTTFIRTDPNRAYSVVNLVYIPQSVLSIGLVAGTKFPGGPAGPGRVPAEIQSSGRLVAAFNGGFRAADGHYGMEVGGTTYVPLRAGLPLLRVFKDGHADLVAAYDGKSLPPDVIAARQNGPLLISNGQTSARTSQGIDLWAGTASGSYITWRSGLGVTAQGDLIYAVGDSLTPTALAEALRLAGSKQALQLDVNAFWVRFMLYQWKGSSYTWSRLIPALADGGADYLNGYEKDFFYLYKKST